MKKRKSQIFKVIEPHIQANENGKYRVNICLMGIVRYFGTWDTIEDAREIRESALEKYTALKAKVKAEKREVRKQKYMKRIEEIEL